MFVIKVKRRFLQVKSRAHSWKRHRKASEADTGVTGRLWGRAGRVQLVQS